MSSAWGSSFGSSWGGSFGSLGTIVAATGPAVVLLPHEGLHFRTRGDLALFALASFTKQEALRVRERYEPLIEIRRVAFRI